MSRTIKQTLLILILSVTAVHSYSQKIIKTFYDYYNIKLKEEYHLDKNGFKNGYYKSFYQNRMPSEVGQYKDDRKTGAWKSYDDDGKLKEESIFKEDEYNGLARVWVNGKGFHNPGADHYFDMGKEIRTVTYYEEGGIQSDIKKDGECKYLYRNNKPAKIWQNHNFEPNSSSIKIWTDDGQPFELQKIVRGIKFTNNADVQYDYSGERSNGTGYYIKPPSEVVGDSSGWRVDVYKGGTISDDNNHDSWDGYIIQKEKADTIIISTYLLNTTEASQEKNILEDLKFLNNPKTYISKKVRYVSKGGMNEGIITTIVYYNSKGEILQQDYGTSQINRNTGRYIFKAQTQNIENEMFGNLSITYKNEGINTFGNEGVLNGIINNTNFTFKYIKENNVLLILKNDKNYISAQRINEKDLKKWIELLDNSPLTFLCYAPEVDVYNEKGEIQTTLKRITDTDEEVKATYFNENTPMSLRVSTATSEMTLKVLADNKNVLDRKNVSSFFSDNGTFDLKQAIGLLSKAEIDLISTFINFSKTYKPKNDDN